MIICVCLYLELEISKKQNEQDKKAIDEFVRERDILNKVRQWDDKTFYQTLS